jgi:hypothetical protein
MANEMRSFRLWMPQPETPESPRQKTARWIGGLLMCGSLAMFLFMLWELATGNLSLWVALAFLLLNFLQIPFHLLGKRP